MVTSVKPRQGPAAAGAQTPDGPPVFNTTTVSGGINLHKALTLPVLLLFMYLNENYTQPAVLYTILHSSYGICWCLKHKYFRDRAFDQPVTPGFLVHVFLMVSLYWVAPYMLMRHRKQDEYLPSWELAVVLVLYTFGMFLHFTSDASKFATLQARGRGLITTGLFSVIRNPNYLGEILIYSSYLVLCRSYAGTAIFLFFLLGVFVPNWNKKDQSLSKYEEFQAYKARTWLVLPYLW